VYDSVKLDDPSFPAPIYANLVAIDEGYALVLRRIKPAFSQAFNRRPVRILFQPHRRPSSAALAVTAPSGWERSQAKAPFHRMDGSA